MIRHLVLFKRYLEHPAHQAGVALWREFATWVIADYEF